MTCRVHLGYILNMSWLQYSDEVLNARWLCVDYILNTQDSTPHPFGRMPKLALMLLFSTTSSDGSVESHGVPPPAFGENRLWKSCQGMCYRTVSVRRYVLISSWLYLDMSWLQYSDQILITSWFLSWLWPDFIFTISWPYLEFCLDYSLISSWLHLDYILMTVWRPKKRRVRSSQTSTLLIARACSIASISNDRAARGL